MRVLITTASFKLAYGGPAVSVARFADALAEVGIETGLWSADQSDPATGRRAALKGSLKQAAKSFGRFDVIHDNGLWLRHNHAVACLARALDAPRIVSIRGMLEPWAVRHKRVKKAIAWRLYQRRDVETAAILHTTSKLECENLARLGLTPRVVMIANGVDAPEVDEVTAAWTRKAARPDGQPHEALFIGRLHPVKGLLPLLDAWARVRPARWRLTLAGPNEGGFQRELEASVTEHGLEASVRFLGPLEASEKKAYLLDADLFVLASFQESFGMSAAEAMAHGVPTLTTIGAPWHEAAVAGFAWRVEPTVDGLASALASATSMASERRRAMGAHAHVYMRERFAWPGVARAFVEAYRAALQSGDGGGS